MIVLGGGLSNMTRLYERVPALWGPHVFSDRVDTRLARARHGDASGVRGAAWLWPASMNARIPLLSRAFAINLALIAGFGAMTQTPAGGPDVIDLQLAMSPGVFKQIVDLWGPETVAAVRRSIWVLDFLFPIAYAFLFSRLYRSLCETRRRHAVPLRGDGAMDRRRRRLRREHPAAR